MSQSTPFSRKVLCSYDSHLLVSFYLLFEDEDNSGNIGTVKNIAIFILGDFYTSIYKIILWEN